MTGSRKIQSTFKCFGICLGVLFFFFFAVSFEEFLKTHLFKNILTKDTTSTKNCFVSLVGVFYFYLLLNTFGTF